MVIVAQQAWVAGGDFNLVRSVDESNGGNLPDNGGIGEFNDCVHTVGLMDLPHEGCHFTWCRNWKKQSIIRVLDRVVCNTEWLQQMKNYTVHVHPAIESDHCSIDVKVHNGIESGPKPFKYQFFWKKHEGFMDIIKEV
ncbi:hypothetical protein LIER_42214 [Lithospermum erythrorhizon]|uniref:Uncharacterized protein n=1 Tax=Lithospermum erythrorhizon TaxID=34254 RepID=A0AAV3RN30_LITER